MAVAAFTQELHPAGGVTGSTLLALVPVFTLLVALAVLRVTAWLAVIIGSVVTILLALFVWDVPTGDTFRSYFYGTAIGAWAVAWIVFWGVVLYNTMVVTGSFDRLKAWLIQHATRDIRVQTILLAWAFGALLEGLVGFGYPWPVLAPARGHGLRRRAARRGGSGDRGDATRARRAGAGARGSARRSRGPSGR